MFRSNSDHLQEAHISLILKFVKNAKG